MSAAQHPDFVLLDGGYLYERSAPYARDVLAAAVQEHGSIEAASKALKVRQAVIRAALGDAAAPPAQAEPARRPTLDGLKDFFGLFAGIAALVYVLGGAVLFARLEIADLSGEAVFGQLPRELLLSVGISQALMPAVLLVTMYAVWRLFRPHVNGAPAPTIIFSALAWWLAGMVVAIVVAGRKNHGTVGPLHGDLGFWGLAAGGLAVAIAGAVAIRVLYARGYLRWQQGPEWLTLAVTYGAVAMVAATIVSATFPLLDARACMSSGFAENGDVVGQNGDRIFLGEHSIRGRRVASLRASDVEELFIGDDARSAQCDPRGRAATTALVNDSDALKRDETDVALKTAAVLDHRVLAPAIKPAHDLAVAVTRADLGSRRVAAEAGTLAAVKPALFSSRKLSRQAAMLVRRNRRLAAAGDGLRAAILHAEAGGGNAALRRLRRAAGGAQRATSNATRAAQTIRDRWLGEAMLAGL